MDTRDTALLFKTFVDVRVAILDDELILTVWDAFFPESPTQLVYETHLVEPESGLS
jgi:hypothetical protein